MYTIHLSCPSPHVAKVLRNEIRQRFLTSSVGLTQSEIGALMARPAGRPRELELTWSTDLHLRGPHYPHYPWPPVG